MPDVNAILVEMVDKERRNLENAVRRRKRAAIALRRADDDIAAISGALSALEMMYRKLHPEEGVQESEPAPPPVHSSAITHQLMGTLAGLSTLNAEEEDLTL